MCVSVRVDRGGRGLVCLCQEPALPTTDGGGGCLLNNIFVKTFLSEALVLDEIYVLMMIELKLFVLFVWCDFVLQVDLTQLQSSV